MPASAMGTGAMVWPEISSVGPGLDARAVTFENPTGARGAGGEAARGRKGAPSRRLSPGERVALADLDGPGVVRHVWMTFPPAPPEEMRAVVLEVFYDGSARPSVSVPCIDFFGVPHGRPVAYTSWLTAIHEGRGFNSYIPMPFQRHLHVELVNGSTGPIQLYYQLDYTLQDVLPPDTGYLHAAFRRANPTTMRDDFVIADGLSGPGRFLGCVVGVRVIDDGMWYGEGEVKMYRDGDQELPSVCGTGLEDYVGSAWGLGPHHALFGGAPLVVASDARGGRPVFVGFYRWHVPDPVVFSNEFRVTIQQIGMHVFGPDQRGEFEQFAARHPAAGDGWRSDLPGVHAFGLHERVDDYSAVGFVYCREPQPVAALDIRAATADLARLAHETPDPLEGPLAGMLNPRT